MVLVCGPRLAPESVKAPKGVEVLGYLPNLYRHMGASDLCIVSGGGTITIELAALGKPFLYFPLEQHFEQEVSVANRNQRYGVGVRMTCSETSPELLAESVFSNIGKKFDYSAIPINGSKGSSKKNQ